MNFRSSRTDLFHSPVSPPPKKRIPYARIQTQEFSDKHGAILRKRFRDEYEGLRQNDGSTEQSGNSDIELFDDQDLSRRRGDGLQVDLRPYMDTSPFSVLETFSIQRAYNLFRSMGLRHLPVVDKCNRVVGILTRKDLQVNTASRAAFPALHSQGWAFDTFGLI